MLTKGLEKVTRSQGSSPTKGGREVGLSLKHQRHLCILFLIILHAVNTQNFLEISVCNSCGPA